MTTISYYNKYVCFSCLMCLTPDVWFIQAYQGWGAAPRSTAYSIIDRRWYIVTFPLYQNPFNVLFVSSYWCFNRLTYIYIHTYICTWRYTRTYIHTNIEVDINWYNINMSGNTWKHKQAPQRLPALRCGTKRWQLNSWASHRLFVILSFAIMLSWAYEIITSQRSSSSSYWCLAGNFRE